MFQTARGPLVGLCEREVSKGVRLWAPAWVNQPGPANVIYLPVFPCETYIDLHWAMVIGENPMPEIIERGYRGYVEHFAKDAYKMNPVIISAGIEGEPHMHSEEPKEEKEILEKCPACHAQLSSWNAHYPVYLTEEEMHKVGIGVAAKEGGSNGAAEPLRHWVCEMQVPDVRERYPDYDPPRPMDA